MEDWALTNASSDTHIYGMFAVVLHGAWVGSFFHGLPAFDLEAFCSKASELKANAMHIVPPVALALAASPIAQKYDMSEVRRIIVAAAPLKVWACTFQTATMRLAEFRRNRSRRDSRRASPSLLSGRVSQLQDLAQAGS
jgi:acyl-coenzyme A synthetase/AMP-(fatty) acid ligase